MSEIYIYIYIYIFFFFFFFLSTALLYILKWWRLGWKHVTLRADIKTSCITTGLTSDFYTRINKLDEYNYGKDRNRTRSRD